MTIPDDLQRLAYSLARFRTKEEFCRVIEAAIAADYQECEEIHRELATQITPDLDERFRAARIKVLETLCRMGGLTESEIGRARDLRHLKYLVLKAAVDAIPVQHENELESKYITSRFFVERLTPEINDWLFDRDGNVIVRVAMEGMGDDVYEQLRADGHAIPEKKVVELALQQGDSVAPETLMKYPDLIAQYGLGT